MKEVVSLFWLLVKLSLAVQVPLSRKMAGWDLCAQIDATPARIPRILHQTYKTADLPDKYRQAHEGWLKETPDWEHRIWTDADNRELIATHYAWFLTTYDSYPDPIMRAHSARYFILHRYGGVYADMDIEALRNPTPLFSGGNDLVLFYDHYSTPQVMLHQNPWGAEEKYQGVANALMASAPRHPFWMFLAFRLFQSSADSASWVAGNKNVEQLEKVFWATGPWFFTITVNEYIKHSELAAPAAIYPKKHWAPSAPLPTGGVLNPCGSHDECKEMYPDSFLFHHSHGSWVHWGPQEKTNRTFLMRSRGSLDRCE